MSKRYTPYIVTAALIIAVAVILLLMGREPICKCGYVKIWHGDTFSSESSQHLMDWYTPSHLLHGILFYGILYMFLRQVDVGWRLAIATLIEVGWEILENTNMIIERYREVTISLDYYGDSVVNSVSDIIAMIAGFWLARVIPVWASVAVVIFFEALTMWLIRDGLALNIIMILFPLDAILEWQAAG
jgi:hypothetical protein